MAKKASDINGWVFIGVGFIVIAVSIFFYDTLKFFMIIGAIMTLYGLGKLAYDKMEKQFLPKEEEWGPVDLNKTKNPYIEKMEQEKKMQRQPQVQRLPQAEQHQQPRHSQQQMQQRQQAHTTFARKYCGSCGSQVGPHHRFCTQCGSRVQ